MEHLDCYLCFAVYCIGISIFAWNARKWRARAKKAEQALQVEYRRQGIEGTGYKPESVQGRLAKAEAREWLQAANQEAADLIEDVERFGI